jgi:hypothetical protein
MSKFQEQVQECIVSALSEVGVECREVVNLNPLTTKHWHAECIIPNTQKLFSVWRRIRYAFAADIDPMYIMQSDDCYRLVVWVRTDLFEPVPNEARNGETIH